MSSQTGFKHLFGNVNKGENYYWPSAVHVRVASLFNIDKLNLALGETGKL